MMKFNINEIFVSIQGEGFFTGTPSLFIRFAFCNLSCPFCDTDNSMKSQLFLDNIRCIVQRKCKLHKGIQHIVITGGEPMLAGDDLAVLVKMLLDMGFVITIETNGIVSVAQSIMDITRHGLYFSISPKSSIIDPWYYECKKVLNLKILFPFYEGAIPGAFDLLVAEYRSIQPIMGDDIIVDIDGAIQTVNELGCPWRLGMQIHKFINVR